MCRLADQECRVDQCDADPDCISLVFRFNDGECVYAGWPLDWIAQVSDAELWRALQVRTGGRIRKPYTLDPSRKSAAFRVVYNSGLIICDPTDAATLCVFYEEVYLPYTGPGSSWRLIDHTVGTEQAQVSRNEITEWDLKYRELFEAGILGRVSAPTERFGTASNNATYLEDEGEKLWNRFREKASKEMGEDRQQQRNRDMRARRSRTERDQLRSLSPLLEMLGLDRDYVREDLVRHLLREDVDLPQIFVNMSRRPSRQLLVALEAKATFRYFLPRVQAHDPAQILELREKVADTRRGFTMRLQELSEGIEERARGSASLKEWEHFAKSVVETKLIPAYWEFDRQLRAKAVRKRDKVLHAAGNILEVDAAITSPKFLGGVLKELGLIESASELEEKLTNKNQAFKFMSEIEAAAVRYAV